MYSSFFKFYFISIIVLILFSVFTIKTAGNNIENTVEIDEGSFVWPLPNNHIITSYFGRRNSPTRGASSYHSGIDIAATEGTPIHSCISGKVIWTGFKGTGGFTLTVENQNMQVSYCHISPNYMCKIGDIVASKSIIAHVGPKNVYNVTGNPYHDSNGNPTNGATTGCHLHLTIKKDGKAVNPLDYFE